jgi:L-alanine-DL-glutamate epimerase-like enolase superfamily enzyme
MRISVHIERWAAVRPFRISGLVWNSFDSIVVEVERDGIIGRGEALGVYYLGETVESLIAQLEAVSGALEAGIDRIALQSILPPGGARNAVDCALWDLDSKAGGKTVWELVGVAPRALETSFTIGLESSAAMMAARAASASAHKLLKIKLDADQPLERVQAIRAARPDARLIVDANQGWTFDLLAKVAPDLKQLGVEMIEQPLPRDQDADLDGFCPPVPLCADESCLNLRELEQASHRYQWINIKLDKTGGLTHALTLARSARERGMSLMVGCMGGSSLAMAPAFVLGCLADLVDLDGPLLQRFDRLPGLSYANGRVASFDPQLWG